MCIRDSASSSERRVPTGAQRPECGIFIFVYSGQGRRSPPTVSGTSGFSRQATPRSDASLPCHAEAMEHR
eukprot:12511184-Alexandrium_andersonii.AAC.1